ncbi:cytochrome c [Flammeovirga yaeyamensis]|uniref:Cytochrome c n=1 Tax=Flammeovirga yaeyamensis TaxID=367791 RepID=A0AAX1N6J8_9BACT|nr:MULTISPECIES: cytochrome c [Flammeovirga]ANQ50948.2 cytochrome c [Flammeovirga sp. MY04]MBB3701176.1 nitrite reductase (NO-forming) [Flammeovirga yaeyamensis]NMF38498.1 cytochrome c [Flammeovirga yaeyamensis]QWG01642.1 cytochrome c [Flammeovirga yaeyamensis]
MKLKYILLSFPIVALLSFTNNDPLKESISRGQGVYMVNCMHCHLQDGQGVEPTVPPLVGVKYLVENKHQAIRQVLHGLEEPITINGVTYDGNMPEQGALSDQEAADVLNYIRNSWGNKAPMISAHEVAMER